MEEEKKVSKRRKIVKIVSFVLLLIVVMWFTWTFYEFKRVNNDKKPLICMNETKDIENKDEYSVTCTGILYKYREYFNNNDEKVAREFTLFFKDFQRNND